MAETPTPELEALPLALEGKKRRFNPSLVWLVPLLAALIGGWLALDAILSRGPTITIQFATGEGLEAGKTRIKYKDVDIGEVSSVTLSADHQHILATVRLVKEAASLLVEDSRFWVVRPRISGGTVSGLGTLLGGAYIAMDAGKSDKVREQFIGLEEAPLITGDKPGHQYNLLAEDLGSLEVGSPVFYRRVPVGQVVGYRLTPNGKNVAVSVFINHPYDAFVTTGSRFWHASGLDVSVDANGLKLNTQSMVSMALGGVAFDSIEPDARAGVPATNHVFSLADDRDHAMRQLDPEVHTYLLRFKESLRGLSVGAPVDFRGITIGEVASIGLGAGERSGDMTMSVRIHVYPRRLLSLAGEHARSSLERYSLQALVAKGLRAQLRNANLLTGQMYVAIDFFPDAPAGRVTQDDGVQVLPTMQGDMVELQRTLGRVIKRVDRMQLDGLSADMRQTLQRLSATLEKSDKAMDGVNRQVLPQMLRTLQSLQQTLDTARQGLSPDSALQQDLRDAAQQVSAAARSVQSLSESLDRHPEALVRGKPGDRR